MVNLNQHREETRNGFRRAVATNKRSCKDAQHPRRQASKTSQAENYKIKRLPPRHEGKTSGSKRSQEVIRDSEIKNKPPYARKVKAVYFSPNLNNQRLGKGRFILK